MVSVLKQSKHPDHTCTSGWLGQIWISNLQTFNFINLHEFNIYVKTYSNEGSESHKHRWRVGIANQKVFARPEKSRAYLQNYPKNVVQTLTED